MLGIALGQMGMSVEDFDQLTPTQFAINYKWYLKRVEIENTRKRFEELEIRWAD